MIAMEALAREVVAYTQPRDRPSPLALVVYSRGWRGRDVRDRNNAMRITAPVENGQLILRVTFPINYVHSIGRNAQDNAEQMEQTSLEYDGSNNIEGCASCVEGHMTYRDVNDIMLFKLLDNGDLGENPLARWSLSFEMERGGNQTIARCQMLQQILRSLLVR